MLIAVPKVPSSNPGENMDVCKSTMPLQHGRTKYSVRRKSSQEVDVRVTITMSSSMINGFSVPGNKWRILRPVQGGQYVLSRSRGGQLDVEAVPEES
ncbi:hypothetical protein TNCV_4377911 [Trichonephila clavipes]|nr:hypothetical protein TNCV_4377911 [Trichonephila clavipes]